MALNLLQNEVPNQLRFEEQRRLLSRVALTVSLILSLYLAITLIVMPIITVGKYIAALAAILIGSLSWLCRHERLYSASAATIVAITVIGGFVSSLSNGGANGFVTPIMISAPVMAAVFIGARATLFSAVAVILSIVSLLYLERIGFVSPAPYSADTLKIASVIMISTSTGICATGVGYFAQAMQRQIGSLRKSQERLMQVSDELDHSAHHDALTGVANRQGLNRHLEALMQDGPREGEKVYLIHVDLDKFKAINDTHGHPVGDAVLKKAAQIMQGAFNDGSFVARVGGDEFVIISSEPKEKPTSEMHGRCERLISELKAPIMVDGAECRVGASIGFAVSDTQTWSTDSLMTDADLALYEAKRDGRGQARKYTTDMRVQLAESRAFSVDIERALDKGQVCCVLQPQVSAKTGRIAGIEGLGRIRFESGELLLPAQILPVLSEAGRLAEFDFLVMQNSLDALAALRKSGADIPSVSINASSNSLRSSDYVMRLCAELEARGLTTDDVIVEVLESTLIESADDAAVRSINRLRDAGVKTIMDDFGMGHATLTNLLKLDLDGLKIDKSLIADIDDNKTFQVLKAVHELAANLDLMLIFEGVETQRQFALLRSMGCDTVQGFGICKPLELAEFEVWLSSYGSSAVSSLSERIKNLA